MLMGDDVDGAGSPCPGEQSQRRALLAYPDMAMLSLRVFFFADHDVCVLCCLGN